MNPDPIRWVVMRNQRGQFHVFSGPQSRLQVHDIPEQQRLGYETIAVVDSEEETRSWVELHKERHLPG